MLLEDRNGRPSYQGERADLANGAMEMPSD